MQTFTDILHPTDYRMRSIYGLRYRVYCEERGFENPEDYPDCIETDEYDEHAVHFATIRNQRIIGTARIVFNTKNGFPLEKHSQIDPEVFIRINRDCIGEISRFAFSKSYRSRFPHWLSPEYQSFTFNREVLRSTELWQFENQTMIRLYRSIFKECRRRNLTHLIAIMADSLSRLLNRSGIAFIPIGPTVHYHGMRTPCICNIERTLHYLKKNHPAVYSHLIS